jgi:hypothetical protein
MIDSFIIALTAILMCIVTWASFAVNTIRKFIKGRK